MPRNAIVKVEANKWVQLTDADATKANVVHQGGGLVFLQGTAGATAPTTPPAQGLPVREKDYGPVGFTLVELFPHIASPVRLWAWTDAGPVNLVVMTD